MPSNHLILCHSLHLLPSIFASIRVLYDEMNWLFASGGQNIGASTFSISPSNGPSNECLGWVSFGDWLVWSSCSPSDSAAAKSLQSCPTLCDPIDGLLPGSSVPGILQERVLEWGAIAFSTKGLCNTTIWSINSLALSLLYEPTLTSIHDYWKSHSFDHMDLCQQSYVSAF